jgi:hypothetical protein
MRAYSKNLLQVAHSCVTAVDATVDATGLLAVTAPTPAGFFVGMSSLLVFGSLRVSFQVLLRICPWHLHCPWLFQGFPIDART